MGTIFKTSLRLKSHHRLSSIFLSKLNILILLSFSFSVDSKYNFPLNILRKIIQIIFPPKLYQKGSNSMGGVRRSKIYQALPSSEAKVGEEFCFTNSGDLLPVSVSSIRTWCKGTSFTCLAACVHVYIFHLLWPTSPIVLWVSTLAAISIEHCTVRVALEIFRYMACLVSHMN